MIISYYMTDIIEVLTYSVIPIPVFLEGFCNFSHTRSRVKSIAHPVLIIPFKYGE